MAHKRWLVGPMVFALLLGGTFQNAWAEGGIVQNASKDAVKGAVKGVGQELNNNSGNIVKGAKQVAKGMVDGLSDAVPQATSQMVKQANVNKKEIGSVARTVSSQAVAGAVGASVNSVSQAIGEDADGKFANAMAAMTEKTAAALVRGIRSEMPDVPKVQVSPWPMVIGIVIGSVSTFLCAALMLLLYIAFQRRRPVEYVQVVQQPQSGDGRISSTRSPQPVGV